MGVGILAKRVVLELGSSTNFVYSLQQEPKGSCFFRAGKEMVFFENSVLLSDTQKNKKDGIKYQHCILHKLLMKFTNF